jgi:phosphoribosylaminoimidazolecarboxamide formyltransferase / IMP cyclohydrolase
VRRIERALISVHDKTGVVEFARGLAEMNVQLISTGGTAKLLSSGGIPVTEVAEMTGFPEILDGRVKTINPRIAAALLAVRDNPQHMQQVDQHGIPLIDLVCVNLYPFVQTTRKAGVTFEQVIENIDIGGPSLLRAAAKNFQDVAVVTSPAHYAMVLDALKRGNGVLDRQFLFGLACKTFVCTARYDAQISQYLSGVRSEGDELKTPSEAQDFPPNVFMDFEKVADLRYGENPHQKAAFYRWGGNLPSGLAGARQLHGKELSFNNIVDLQGAWNLVREFTEPACAIIKHTNPCGTAVGSSLCEAYVKAYEADTVSAFGSIIALNRPMDRGTATEVSKLFVEAIIAPAYDDEALAILNAKKNLRLIAHEESIQPEWSGVEIKQVDGGVLLQITDAQLSGPEERVVTKRQPSDEERVDLEFGWRVVKHVKSNAIVLARGGRTVGVGAGQMSRVDAVRLSIQKALPSSRDAVLASDAFFPFRDSVDEAAKAGITAIIQPGGSVRDSEVIAAADEYGLTMIITGLRHFKH